MKAALVTGAGQIPVYGDFKEPETGQGLEVVTVSAAALTNATKSRAAGSHYSASGAYPLVPGVDGVGRTAGGERVYFALPQAPFGGMAQKTLVRTAFCVPLPDGLDDVTATALGNPGMSSVAALRFRADLKAGETVLVNGATGAAGKLAVQLAKYLGAKKVIATGRNAEALEALEQLGAGVTINLTLDQKDLSDALAEQFSDGIDVVLDYLFGKSAEMLLAAAAAAMKGNKPLRYVEVGDMSGSDFALPVGALRAKPIVLMGSGIGSVSLMNLIEAVATTMQAAVPAGLAIGTRTVPLADVGATWNADPGRDRIVFAVEASA